MKKLTSFLFYLLCIVAALAFSCGGKKNTTPPPTKTTFDRSDIAGKTFNFTGGFTGNITFNNDGTYSLNTTSGVAPDGSTGVTSTGNWSFDANSQTLTLTPSGGLPVTIAVSGFADNKLTLNYIATKTNSPQTASAPRV
ncbi:MAG: copper resistance protein NlpE [Cytophagales bacterium]|nr:copper resistance protein NlpE [Cytophagales bacterium]MDW8383911.1 DUF5004 domain-containing protein [Flammeovirgaceae bacterium]